LWLLALGSWLTRVCRIAPILTGHPSPSWAASESSCFLRLGSWLLQSSGHPRPSWAAAESSWLVSLSLRESSGLDVSVCVLVYTDSSTLSVLVYKGVIAFKFSASVLLSQYVCLSILGFLPGCVIVYPGLFFRFLLQLLLLASGFWILAFGFWLLASEYSLLV
jgi:hypothetical protein